TSKSGSGAAGDGGYEYEEESVQNSRGMKLFTCRWLPPKGQIVKAHVFLCHGYAVECSVTMRGTGVRLAQAGYAVYGVDYEGHGKSEGLQGYIPSFDLLVSDTDAFFTAVVASTANTDLPRFILGESMGGAVALLLHRMRPAYWTGAVLVAPMCKIADEMRPHPVVVSVLKLMTNIIPTWKIVPTTDVIDAAYRMQEKRDEIRNNPHCYQGKPRLKTAYELLKVSLNLENNITLKVSLPFLIVHGGDDKVTDPSVSDLLYRSAVSQDKKLNLYPGMWHALTSGESPENIHTKAKHDEQNIDKQ
uniref:Serine aminopeptidase S33 domain-containing protein n=1 Tax=Aegilops tauschii subsp. strangulata TaxID=200361 RepID=A0A453KFM6_AEGTS